MNVTSVESSFPAWNIKWFHTHKVNIQVDQDALWAQEQEHFNAGSLLSMKLSLKFFIDLSETKCFAGVCTDVFPLMFSLSSCWAPHGSLVDFCEII